MSARKNLKAEQAIGTGLRCFPRKELRIELGLGAWIVGVLGAICLLIFAFPYARSALEHWLAAAQATDVALGIGTGRASAAQSARVGDYYFIELPDSFGSVNMRVRGWVPSVKDLPIGAEEGDGWWVKDSDHLGVHVGWYVWLGYRWIDP